MDGVQMPIDGSTEVKVFVAQQIEAMLTDSFGFVEGAGSWQIRKGWGSGGGNETVGWRTAPTLGKRLAGSGSDLVRTHADQAR